VSTSLHCLRPRPARRRELIAGGAALALLGILGCSPAASYLSDVAPTQSASPAAEGFGGKPVPVVIDDPRPVLPVTVTDTTGRQVTVTDISRIVSLSGGITETLFSYGLGDHVIGRDISTLRLALRQPVSAAGLMARGIAGS